MATIRFKTIKPVFETFTVREGTEAYLAANRKLHSPQAAVDLFSYLADEAKEHFISLHMDSKSKVLAVDFVATGSLNACVVHPREVFKSALLSSAAALILIHNHPSGDPEPSREDIALTKRLTEGGELLGIRILDHIVIGDCRHYSFADHGQI